MNILIAPSGFKESLSPEEVADCIEQGILRALPDAKIHKTPLVDGGEGFTKTLVGITGGTLHRVRVTSPIGQTVDAFYGILGGAGLKTVVLEMASAAGIRLVPKHLRNPLLTTTYGVGELIKAALDAGAQRLLIGCADSATNDGGVGMAQALGVRLLDSHGNAIGWGGGALSELDHIDLSERDSRLNDVQIDVACNFNSFLCGPDGASRLFGPQKGASPSQVELLDKAMNHFANILERDLKIKVRRMPGGGAAGGLGTGLHALLNAKLHHRFSIVMQYLDIDTPLATADLVITAEGMIDSTSFRGKIPGEVARRAQLLGIPVVAIVGQFGKGTEVALSGGIESITDILDRPMDLAEAFDRAPELLTTAAERLMHAILVGKKLAITEHESDDSDLQLSGHFPSDNLSEAAPLYLNNLARDLRDPLSVMISYAKMLQDGLLGEINPMQAHALLQIVKHASWVLSITKGLMNSMSYGEMDQAVNSTMKFLMNRDFALVKSTSH